MNSVFAENSLTDVLISEGLLTTAELNEHLSHRKNTSEPLGDMLVRAGAITERDKARCIGRQLGVPFIDLAGREMDATAARLITQQMAVRLCAIPIERGDTGLSVVMANPVDITAIDELREHTHLEIDTFIGSEDDIREAIGRTFGSFDDLTDLIDEAMSDIDPAERQQVMLEDEDGDAALTLKQLAEISGRSPVVRLVNGIFARAVGRKASDIHIEPERTHVRVRYRVDGMLQEVMRIPKDLQFPMISRLKIMASMDIAERRAPQDGRISLLMPQGEFDFRVSTYPSLHGEKVVMRILDKRAARVALDKIGIQPDTLVELERLIQRPHGMILVCGPTGSGKTTTLYACLNSLNSPERNIMTIEDPVEYQLPGIIQGNVNVKAGVTFATGLRTLVRQDPDVILVGEIRDAETARIAIEASLTGHLVLSTIHANDSAGAVARLVDMGVEPFLVASALVATLAQRLVRTICTKCTAPCEPDVDMLKALRCESLIDDPEATMMRGTGCDSCNRQGYKGRSGIHELMEVNVDVRKLILESAPSQELKRVGLAGRRSLREDGILKLKYGLTTTEELLRVTID